MANKLRQYYQPQKYDRIINALGCLLMLALGALAIAILTLI